MLKLSHITILDQYAVDMDIILGKGSTGCVYQCLQMKTGRKVAIKIVVLRTIDNQVAQYLLNMQKFAIMKGLKVTQDNQNCFMITQYCNGGTLKKYIKNTPQGYLKQQKALNLFYQLLLGYKALVQNGIVHRDLKPANIMLHNDIPKIIDFGYCQIKGFPKPNMEYNVGSPSYMAPQSFQHNVYNQKSQIWALGVILFQCLTGKTIDEGRHMGEVYHELQKYGLHFPAQISSFSRNIINWCLNKNPKDRPSCLRLIQTFSTTKNRAKSKISPFKKEISQQIVKKFPKQTNIFKQVYINNTNKKYLKQENLNKSTKMDPKTKFYKIPQFLTSSLRNKQLSQTPTPQKYNRHNICYSVHGNYPQKSDKIQKKAEFRQRDQDKLNKEFKVDSNWEYGNYKAIKRNCNNILNCDKRVYKNQLHPQIMGSQKVQKNRVISSQITKLFIKKPAKITDKQQLIVRKRTTTDRTIIIRA